MVTLRWLLAAAALAAATPAPADPIDRWRPLIAEAAARFGVPELWIERVMHAESRGLNMLAGRPIISHAGAMGLMQLMPATWAEMRGRLGLGTNPHDPRDNILAGTFYLRLMYDRFGYPGLFGAYNAGPGRYAAYAAGYRRLPAETQAYLTALTETTGAATERPAATPHVVPVNALFAVRREEGMRSAVSSVPALFVPLRGDSDKGDYDMSATNDYP